MSDIILGSVSSNNGYDNGSGHDIQTTLIHSSNNKIKDKLNNDITIDFFLKWIRQLKDYGDDILYVKIHIQELIESWNNDMKNNITSRMQTDENIKNEIIDIIKEVSDKIIDIDIPVIFFLKGFFNDICTCFTSENFKNTNDNNTNLLTPLLISPDFAKAYATLFNSLDKNKYNNKVYDLLQKSELLIYRNLKSQLLNIK